MIDYFWLLWHPVNIEILLLCLATQTAPALVWVSPINFCSYFPLASRSGFSKCTGRYSVEGVRRNMYRPLGILPLQSFLLRVFKLVSLLYSLKSFHCSQLKTLIQQYCYISFSLVWICQTKLFSYYYILGTYLVHGI